MLKTQTPCSICLKHADGIRIRNDGFSSSWVPLCKDCANKQKPRYLSSPWVNPFHERLALAFAEKAEKERLSKSKYKR